MEEICARYHRQLETSVLTALVSKSGPNAVPWSMPLWLVIVAEELNLIDADDFSRAARDYTGRDDQRLTALMCDLIDEMPADVQQMYRVSIARAESIFGPELVSAFLATICIGRFGWREMDFRALLPRLSGEAWDELRFANLRRLFRGHLRRREPLGRWDFHHGQMRLASRNWLAKLGFEEATVHAAIADHLLTLSTDDPVRVEEVMVHLLGAEDWGRAARYLSDNRLDEPGAIGADRVMVDMIRTTPEHAPPQAANTLARLLEVEGLDTAAQSRVARHLLNVHFRTQGRCSLASEEALLVPLEAYLDRIVSQEPGNRVYLEQHSAGLMWLGNLYRDQGDLKSSLECFRCAESIDERMADAAPVNGRPRERLAGPSLNRGDALFAKGDLDGALAIYRHPAHADSSAAHCRIGNVLRMRNDLEGALASYGTGIEILKRELQENPANEPAGMNLGIALSTIGSTLLQKKDFDGALDYYRSAEKIIAGHAAKNPTEPSLHFESSLMRFRIGQALLMLSDRQGARESLIGGISILERVVAQHPDNPNYLYHLSLFNLPLGDLLFDEGDINGARVHWRAAAEVLKRLVARDPENAEWRKSLDAALGRIDHTVRTREGAGEPALHHSNARRILNGLSRILSRKRRRVGV